MTMCPLLHAASPVLAGYLYSSPKVVVDLSPIMTFGPFLVKRYLELEIPGMLQQHTVEYSGNLEVKIPQLSRQGTMRKVL